MLSKADQILTNILSWANQEENIRLVALAGSRARPEIHDDLADFDVNIFCRAESVYLQANDWFEKIGVVWVWLADAYNIGKLTVPTRLIIFDDGIKVDFSFFSLKSINKARQSSIFEAGYKVLLDKDGLTEKWRPSKIAQPVAVQPSEAEFSAVVNEFWFEAYHIAKYLKREELWLAKFRDWSTKEFLLKIIEWHAQAKNPGRATYYLGKHMQEWVAPEIWNVLHGAFAYFDSADSWQALYTSTWLFRRLAKEIAQIWQFSYPEATDKAITEFINQLQEQQ